MPGGMSQRLILDDGVADYHPLSVRRFAPAIKRMQRQASTRSVRKQEMEK